MNVLGLLTEEYQSGDSLAQHLGCSRVAVWKHIQHLSGYPIETSKQGYRFIPGTPYPQKVQKLLKGSLGQNYHYLDSTDSTQNQIKKWAEAGAAHGTVVCAEKQQQGRGRRGKEWVSGEGLYFSVLLRPSVPLTALSVLPLQVGVAVQRACGVGLLKWPNDVLTPEGKLAGILLEANLHAEEVQYMVLGIGINTHSAPKGGAILGQYRAANKAELLVELLWQLEQHMFNPESLALWHRYNCTLNQNVRVHTARGIISGKAVGIDDSGALLVQENGAIVPVTAGDVELIGRVQ